MTIESWKQEFYPVEATAVSADEATQHSLNKWRGLTPENLTKHGLNVTFIGNLREASETVFEIGSESCALCQRFYNKDTPIPGGCEDCPLYLFLGMPCDRASYAPYRVWLYINDPHPMIEALEKTVAMLEAENAKLQ